MLDVSPSWFCGTATPGTRPRAGEKNSSPLEWLSIKLWLHVHWGDSLKEMCARSVVVCCRSHPWEYSCPPPNWLQETPSPSLTVPPFFAGSPIREKSRCAVLPQNPRVDFMVLQNQPKGINCFLAQFHVKQKTQKWVNGKQRVKVQS